MDPAAPPRLDQRRGVSTREDRRALELDARGELTQPPHARLDPRTAHRGRAPPYRRALLARPSVPLGEGRSEEHTSELQSQSNLVCRLLLEKKKTRRHRRLGTRKP